MPGEPGRILVTGANGHLGRQLIARLVTGGDRAATTTVRVLVRSERAAAQLEPLQLEPPDEVVIGDYTDAEAMSRAVDGCARIVHLVGIIKETRNALYTDAHESTCRILADTASKAGASRIVYLSIFGAGPDSSNACLASKGQAEQILLNGEVPVTVLRVPMVIGPEDFASAALRGSARSRVALLVNGGRTMQQPIDSRDVVSAIVAALDDRSQEMHALDLGGPERITQKALVQRVAKLHGRRPLILPVPLAASRAFAGLMEKVAASPPITRAMLEVLEQDDRIDEAAACQRLGLTLTPLDDTLREFVGPEGRVA